MAVFYPVGIQSFERLRKEGRLYVDKTSFIYDLVRAGGSPVYFLSRPRRFGKSLLINTLKAIFEGKKELFKGLYIEDKIEWESYPIIHLSMDAIGSNEIGLYEALKKELASIEKEHGLNIEKTESLGVLFRELISALHKKYDKQVAILVDEYDKPITHGLEKDDVSLAEKNRDIMKNLYGGLKSMDDSIRFLFITGISKFAKVSIFSDLNHLTDISLDKRFAAICGYTQTELEQYFEEGIHALAEENELTYQACLDKLKYWYNGFSWDAKTFVYNPFSTLKLLESRQFHNYWFETGTPTFLVKMLSRETVYKMQGLKVNAQHFEAFDFQRLDYKTLLLQTGYLTLKKALTDDRFEASYPNKEVEQAFEWMLLGEYLHDSPGNIGINIYDIRDAFLDNDLDLVMKIIETMFHSLPAELFSKKDKSGNIKAVSENFYHAIIYLIFNLLGIKMQAEVSVKEGRIDALVETQEHIYVFEFKKDESPELALGQIEAREYMKQYSLSPKTIHLIGVRFSLETRGIHQADWATKIWASA